MTFGYIIKNLRTKNNMTQERLAELLNISPQAVSRWETSAAMPDISLLPPLANLFGVTTDYLLSMDTYQKDLRKAKFDKAFFLCGEQKYDEAVIALTKARHHAEQDTIFSKQDYYRYTVPLFHLVGGEKPVSDSADTPLDGYRASLTRSDFDPIRDRSDFQVLMK